MQYALIVRHTVKKPDEDCTLHYILIYQDEENAQIEYDRIALEADTRHEAGEESDMVQFILASDVTMR